MRRRGVSPPPFWAPKIFKANRQTQQIRHCQMRWKLACAPPQRRRRRNPGRTMTLVAEPPLSMEQCPATQRKLQLSWKSGGEEIKFRRSTTVMKANLLKMEPPSGLSCSLAGSPVNQVENFTPMSGEHTIRGGLRRPLREIEEGFRRNKKGSEWQRTSPLRRSCSRIPASRRRTFQPNSRRCSEAVSSMA